MGKIVTVKADRKCYKCGKPIKKGSKAYTFSIKYKGRNWVCKQCCNQKMQERRVQPYKKCDDYKRIARTLASMKSVAFGDEGAWQADFDSLAEYSENCELCEYENCPYKNGDYI